MSIWYVSSKIGNSGNSGSDPGNPSNDLDLVVGKAADGDEIVIVDEYVADTAKITYSGACGALADIPANKTLIFSGLTPYSKIEANATQAHSNAFFANASLKTENSTTLIFKNLLFVMHYKITAMWNNAEMTLLAGVGGNLYGVTANFYNCCFVNEDLHIGLTYEQKNYSTLYFNNCSFLSTSVRYGYKTNNDGPNPYHAYFVNSLCSGEFTNHSILNYTNCYGNAEFNNEYKALNYDNKLYGVYSGEYPWQQDKQFLEISNKYYTIQEENNND